VFAPTAPTEYNAALNAKLDAGSAGDLITCRPFDASLELYKKGYLADITERCRAWRILAGRQVRLVDGRRFKATFCVPMASVIHGFIYNKDAFDKLGIAAEDEADFFAALDKIKADGTYIPLAMGTKDLWEAATMGYQNIGPNYWKGEEGRLALIKGEQKLTDPIGSSPTKSLPSGSPISATVSKPRPIRTARTCSRSAALPSIRPARGKSAASTRRPSSRWAHSRRRSKKDGDHLLHLRPYRHRQSA
jgi:raffinose/stachyose/melibiose transport system substrate-binding protein